MLVRVRDGSLACLRQLKKEESKRDTKDVSKTEQLCRQLTMAVGFLQALQDVACSSLFPGACYQRKRTALDMVSLLYETLLYRSGVQSKTKCGTAG